MKYCLIGEKLKHSYSEVIHRKLGLDYCLVEIEKEKLNNFFENNLRESNYDKIDIIKDVENNLKIILPITTVFIYLGLPTRLYIKEEKMKIR